MDQIEAEVENEDNEEEINFEVNWRNDFEELEKALEDDSGELKFLSTVPVRVQRTRIRTCPHLKFIEMNARRHNSERLLSFHNLTCSGNLESYKIGSPYD